MRPDPSHTTVRTGPYTAVRQVLRPRRAATLPARRRAGAIVRAAARRRGPLPSDPWVSPVDEAGQGRNTGFSGALSSSSCTRFDHSKRSGLGPGWAGGSARGLPGPPGRTTTPSADFSVAIGGPCGPLSRALGAFSHRPTARRRSPEVSSTAFAARPPDLQDQCLMDVDFAVIGPLVRLGLPSSGSCTSGRGC